MGSIWIKHSKSLTIYLAIWGEILGRNLISAAIVRCPLANNINWQITWQHTLERNHLNVINVIKNSNSLMIYHATWGHILRRNFFSATNVRCFFAQNSNLTIHMDIHSAEKPFKCNQCDKAFSQSVGLSRHMSTHSGDKPLKFDQYNR